MKNTLNNATKLRELAAECAKKNLENIIKQQDAVIVRHILRQAKALSKLQVFEVRVDVVKPSVLNQLLELGFNVHKKGIIKHYWVVSW